MQKEKREKIEREILEASDSIRRAGSEEGYEWLFSPTIDQFIHHFEELRIYYRDTGDSVMSRSILLEFFIRVRSFQDVVNDPFDVGTGEEIPQTAKAKAKEYIEHLNWIMDKIIEYEI